MKIIVTGGRDYSDFKKLEATLNDLYPALIIQGGATGADSLAREYSKIKKIKCQTYEANWDDLSQPDARIKKTKFGKSYDAQAGHRRNHKMLSENQDALVVVFPGGAGTRDCEKTARKLGMKVLVVSMDK